MGTINFSTAFTGGAGSMDITSFDSGDTLHFTQKNKKTQSVTLPTGNHFFSIRGAAPDGEGGSIVLSITGDIPAEIDHTFPSGDIPPHTLTLFVTA